MCAMGVRVKEKLIYLLRAWNPTMLPPKDGVHDGANSATDVARVRGAASRSSLYPMKLGSLSPRTGVGHICAWRDMCVCEC